MNEPFHPSESLQLIRTMIEKTRENLSENRFYFLLWGWVTFVAILTQFALKVLLRYERHYLVWLVTIPAVIVTIVYSGRHHKRSGVRSYVSDAMGSVWMGIGISFFVLSLIVNQLPGSWMNAWPFFILFYGLGTFVSGRILNFTPLVIGGIANWLLAIVSVFVPYDYQLLLAAGAILTSYIIPGHLLGAYKR